MYLNSSQLKLCFGFLCVVFNMSFSYSQNQKKIDSLLKLINETKSDTIKAINYLHLSDLTMYNNTEKTLEYIETASKLYKKTNNDKGVAKLYAQKANYYYRLGNIDSARHYLINSVDKSLSLGDTLRAAVIRHNVGILDQYQGDDESASNIMDTNIEVFKKYNDSLHLANAYLIKGSIAIYQGFSTIALKESYNALKIHQDLKNDFRIAEALLQIGIIYQNTDDHQKAVDIFKETIILYDKVENQQTKAQALNYIANSYINLKKFDEAEAYSKESLEISKKLKYKANIARTYKQLGFLEYEKGNFNKAITYYTKSYNLWLEVGSTNNQARTLLDIGKSYIGNKDYQTAIKYLNKSIDLAKQTNDTDVLGRAFYEKSIALEKLGKYKASLAIFKENKKINDSIFTTERGKATQELKTIYETEKKEQQIVFQENEINLLEEKAKVSNLQKLLLGSGLTLSLIAIGFGFYGFRQKIKRNKVEKEKLDNELAFKKKELTTHALHLAKKNEVLENLKQQAQELKSEQNIGGYQHLIRTIDFDLQDDNNWENFSNYFQQVHKDFNSRIKKQYPKISASELRFLSLVKMNLSSKEIASILNISNEGIKKARYRVRKKLQLDPNESLEDLIFSI